MLELMLMLMLFGQCYCYQICPELSGVAGSSPLDNSYVKSV